MKKLLFVFALIFGAILMAETPVAGFAPGERVVFFGDSITHGGGYIFHIQMFEDLRYPGSGTVMLNAGISRSFEGRQMTCGDHLPVRTHFIWITRSARRVPRRQQRGAQPARR